MISFLPAGLNYQQVKGDQEILAKAIIYNYDYGNAINKKSSTRQYAVIELETPMNESLTVGPIRACERLDNRTSYENTTRTRFAFLDDNNLVVY